MLTVDRMGRHSVIRKPRATTPPAPSDLTVLEGVAVLYLGAVLTPAQIAAVLKRDLSTVYRHRANARAARAALRIAAE
jgi:DNA-binding CsgD family transcriptional regulator